MIALGSLRNIRAFLVVEGIGFLTVALIHAGVLAIGSPHAAALPEGIIAAVLLGAFALTLMWRAAARPIGIGAQSFALALTVIGTFVTVIGIGPSNPWDLPFHLGMLVVLVCGIAVAAHDPQTMSARETAMTVVRWLIRATGLLQLALGLAFWTGALLIAIPFHIFNGLLFSLLLEVQVVLAASSGVPARWVWFAAARGLFVPALGLSQTRILPGEWHWVVQLAHLGVGLVAIGLAERLAREARVRLESRTHAGGRHEVGGVA